MRKFNNVIFWMVWLVSFVSSMVYIFSGETVLAAIYSVAMMLIWGVWTVYLEVIK